MGIYQDKKSGNWYFEASIYGKRYHRACKNATNRDEAKAFVAKFKSKLYRGHEEYVEKKAYRLDKLRDFFVEYSKTNKKTHYMDELFSRYFLEITGNKYIDEISFSSIEKWKTERLKKVVANSVNRELDSIRRMFSLAVKEEWINQNPCNGVQKIPGKNKKERYLTPAEEKAVYKHCIKDKAYMKPIIMMALHTGLRKSNILNLTWDCVDFTQEYFTFLDTKNNKVLKIPISNKLLKELEKLPRENAYVFPNSVTGKPYNTIHKAFKAILNKAGISEEFRFHDLRHTAATRMVVSGIDLVVVQEILSHADIRVTRRYAHPVPERKLAAIKALNNYK